MRRRGHQSIRPISALRIRFRRACFVVILSVMDAEMKSDYKKKLNRVRLLLLGAAAVVAVIFYLLHR
jgi:hypothetical protein